MSRQLSAQSINTVVAFSVVSPEIRQAIESIKYIAENMRSRNKAREVSSPKILSDLSLFEPITIHNNDFQTSVLFQHHFLQHKQCKTEK